MMPRSLPLLLLALSLVPLVLSAPTVSYDGYTGIIEPVKVPQKRAALVLDRLLVALQRALREGDGGRARGSRAVIGPRTAPLRIAGMDDADLNMLQRRGPQPPRVRVIHCYFNAVTCF
ncbi:hypothetical protein O0L34_g6000 [Tuta absoluta]|nr:hypothetical protein O0L34_g6000 [Tuta absoluta]